MEILEMIAEWRKGCSLSGKNAINCPACTEALIDSIQHKEEVSLFSGCITPRFDQVIDRLKAVTHLQHERRRGHRTDVLVSVADIEALLHEFYRVDRQLRRFAKENSQLRDRLESKEEDHRVC